MNALQDFVDARMGDTVALEVTPLAGGGSCETFALDRGDARWVLRRAPRHASSSTAHDVLREFRILDAIKECAVRIARPLFACADPTVFDAPFYVMERIDGRPVVRDIPAAWQAQPGEQGRALTELIDAIVEVHAVDWQATGLGDFGPEPGYLARQIPRWLAQLDSYRARELPAARVVGDWLVDHLPVEQAPALCHGDYKLDNVLFRNGAEVPDLVAVVDWEMASINDPLVDLAWALIFHPGTEGTMRLGMANEPRFTSDNLPSVSALVQRYTAASGRGTSAIDWYHVFARWKLAIVLEGSHAKFVRGESSKPVHQFFGQQADLLLRSANELIERSG